MMLEYALFLFRGLIQILLARLLKSDLERQYFLVLKENQILKRKLGKRQVPLRALDRHFYVAVCRACRWLLSSAVVIRPETILGWHRRLAFFKDGLCSTRQGRPPVTGEVRELALRMKSANPRWGYKRIAGEIRKLGIQTCKTSIAKILKEGGWDPKATRRAGISWRTFMESQGKRMWACDFFSVTTIFMQKTQVFFMINLESRAIEMVAIHKKPTGEWLRNRLRSFFVFCHEPPGILISDRAGVFQNGLKEFLEHQYGIEHRQTPPYCPQLNGYAERMVRTFREELTDRVLIFGEKYLERMVREYVEYYNRERVHSSIEFRPPKSHVLELSPFEGAGGITARKVLDGLITDFQRSA